MSVYRFDTGGLPTCGKTAGVYYRIEFATQDVSTWPLTKPSWTSPTALTNPFTFGGISVDGEYDAGQQVLGDITLEAQNTILTGTTRIMSILDAIDKDATDLHVRVGWGTNGSTFVYKFWGIVDWTSLQINYGDFADQDTWLVRFTVRDSLFQLQSRSVKNWFDEQLLHIDYDYKVADGGFYTTYIGTPPTGGATAGRWQVQDVRYTETGGDGQQRQLWYAETDLRFMRISEILQSISDYLGLSTNINGGAGSLIGTSLHTTQYGINTANPTGTTMTWGGIDNLYVLSGLYVSGYKQEGTFFEDDASDRNTPFAFRRWNSVLEVLKNICISLGMVCRVTVDGSSERQLTFIEVGQAEKTASYAQNLCIKGAELVPYIRGLEGAQVTVSSGSDVKRGNVSSKSVNVNCIFSSCNNTRVQGITEFPPPLLRNDLYLGEDVMSALYVSTETPSGSRGSSAGDALDLATMYSVCAVYPKVAGTAAPSTSLIESYGKYQSSAPFGINAVMYPNDAAPYNCWVEVPGMAVAHLYYSSKQGTDDISVYRTKGQSLNVKVRPINQYTYYPGDQITLTIAGVAVTWVVVSYEENWKDDYAAFQLERFYA